MPVTNGNAGAVRSHHIRGRLWFWPEFRYCCWHRRPPGWTPNSHEAIGFRLRAMLPGVQDTSPAADARYHELLRGLLPERRLLAAMKLSRAVRQLALVGIRESFPAATEQELRVRLTVRLYGRAAAERLFGSAPADAR